MKLLLALAVAMLCAAGGSAFAGSNRVWVSGHGTDTAGCGAPVSPCRSFQYAHDHVNAGGEVDVLDPAGYGAVTITKAISIINDGAGTAGVQASSGSAITVQAGPTDAVVLRGLNIEGTGSGAGVYFAGGASLTLEDSALSNFSDAIFVQPSGVGIAGKQVQTLYVSRTRINSTPAGGIGVFIKPQITTTPPAGAWVQATLDRVEAINNGEAALYVDGQSSDAGVVIWVTVADSVLANNANEGVLCISSGPGALSAVMVRNTTITYSLFGVITEFRLHPPRPALDFRRQRTGVCEPVRNPRQLWRQRRRSARQCRTGDHRAPALVRLGGWPERPLKVENSPLAGRPIADAG